MGNIGEILNDKAVLNCGSTLILEYFLRFVNRILPYCYRYGRGGESLIYDNIVKLCDINGVSIRAVEIACGLGNGTISWWKDHNPRADRLKLVADYFGVTVDYLMSEDL